MQLIKPLWLKHGGEKKDFEVYSCHVSPDGLRLVTAAGDGNVRIWSTEAIYNGSNAEYTKPRQLAALGHHSGTVHTARFSSNNKFLASGADDKFVLVYVLDKSAPPQMTFGAAETPPVENWRIYRRLVGHENDVQDLGWSCDSSILVSVGLDSRVVVWSGHTFEKLKTLSGHSSHVKGITFDPANKYFATASDDRTIKIFRYTAPAPNATAYDSTNNFMIEHTITTPFVSSPLTTYFRRCSWSPDGNHIAGANAVNGPVSTAVIIDRGTWDSHINLVGHEAPVEVCAFSPRIFGKQPISQLDENDKNGVTVIACAGQDNALSIWNTMSSKPLCVNENLTMKSISDLAWSPDGESLFFCSLDGTIALARFGIGELGYPMPLDINEDSLKKYGAGRKVGVVEGPDALLLEEKSKGDELRNVEGRMGELMGESQPNGKDLSNGLTTNVITNGTTAKINGVPPSNGVVAVEAERAIENPRVEKLKQRVTITKDGKKRVAPLLVSASVASNESSLPSTQLRSTLQTPGMAADGPQNILDLSKPYDGLPKGGLGTLLFGNKRKLAETGAEGDAAISHRIAAAGRAGATSIMANTPEGLVPVASEEALERPSALNPAIAFSPIRLAIPVIRPLLTRALKGRTQNHDNGPSSQSTVDDSPVMEVRNPGASRTGRLQDKDPSRITVTKRGQILWQDFLPKAVALVTGNARFWAAATEDGSLYTWSPAGRRLFPAMALEAQTCILDCRGPFLLCLTAVGLAHIWNIEAVSSPHPPVSLAPVLDMAASAQGPHLTAGPSIIFARLNSEGRIVIAMSNGDAYTYSAAMHVWQRLSEAWWAVGSQYWNSSDSAQTMPNRSADSEENDVVRLENLSAGIIPTLERNTTSQILLRGRAYFLQRLVKALLSAEGYEGFESGVSVAHLENRLAAALTLGAKEEFKVYLGMYAKRLGAEGSRLKIEELLRNLLRGYDANGIATRVDGKTSPPNNDYAAGFGKITDELCGWKREVLLKEVVVILGKYRDLQRVTVPYARMLGITAELGSRHETESLRNTGKLDHETDEAQQMEVDAAT